MTKNEAERAAQFADPECQVCGGYGIACDDAERETYQCECVTKALADFYIGFPNLLDDEAVAYQMPAGYGRDHRVDPVVAPPAGTSWAEYRRYVQEIDETVTRLLRRSDAVTGPDGANAT